VADPYNGGDSVSVVDRMALWVETYGEDLLLHLTEDTDATLTIQGWLTAPVGQRLSNFIISETKAAVKIGMNGNDSLTGFNVTGLAAHEVFFGLGGNDTLHGLGGHDVLDGGKGEDCLYGDEGDDFLSGGEGNDILYGGIGDDTYYWAFDGSDVIHSDEYTLNDVLIIDGSITFERDQDNLVLSNAAHDDVLTLRGWFLQPATERLNYFIVDGEGSVVHDVISDGRSGNSLLGLNEIIYTEYSPYTLGYYGYNGDDTLFGLQEDLYLHGGAGDDFIEANERRTKLYGDEGNDVLVAYEEYCDLYGGMDNDVLYTDGYGCYSYGQDGDDILYNEGNGVLDGGRGNDTYVVGLMSNTFIANQDQIADRGVDTVLFSNWIAGLTSDDFTYSESDGNLTINCSNQAAGTGIRIFFRDWFEDEMYQVDKIVFGDGVTLTAAEISAKVY